MKNWLKLLISIAFPLGVGTVAGLFTSSEIDGWYRTISKPSWQPPNWVFAPVWAVLYVMMGLAFYLVWQSAAASKPIKRMAITLWIIQLVFNFFWSFIFFKQHQIDWALAEILLLWFFILLTIFYFARINKTAAWLMVPYICWVSFASLLTFSIYELNIDAPKENSQSTHQTDKALAQKIPLRKSAGSFSVTHSIQVPCEKHRYKASQSKMPLLPEG